jgi:hypothetical protein
VAGEENLKAHSIDLRVFLFADAAGEAVERFETRVLRYVGELAFLPAREFGLRAERRAEDRD